MKIIFSIILLFFTILINAQNPLLLNRNWEITKLYVDGVSQNIPSNPEKFYLEFSNITNNIKFHTKICDLITGNINYHPSLPEFTLLTTNIQELYCPFSPIATFNQNYKRFFTKNAGNGNKINYRISSTPVGYELILTNKSNDMVYFDFNSPKPSFSNYKWNLSALNINSTQYEAPQTNPWMGPSTFSENVRFHFFNTSFGNAGYGKDNSLQILGLATTLAQSDDEPTNTFDNLFHGQFLRGTAAEFINPFSYQVNGNQLTITNGLGNKAFFNKAENLGKSLIDGKWSIINLKIGNIDYIPTRKGTKLNFGEENLQGYYFNVLKAEKINYSNNNQFSFYNATVSIIDSYDPDIATFDFYYLENFMGERGTSNPELLNSILPNNPFQYEISPDGKTLKITNNKGDVATYTNELLSVKDTSATKIRVYPNPVTDVLKVKNIDHVSLIKIFDSSGKSVQKIMNSGNKNLEIQMGYLPSGLYFIQFNEETLIKVIKK